MPVRNSKNTRVIIQKVKENDMLDTSIRICIRYPDYNLVYIKNKRKM
ncbi:hypothetical protein [Paenibacillus sp. IHBB 3054]